jgi:hypothetical protein
MSPGGGILCSAREVTLIRPLSGAAWVGDVQPECTGWMQPNTANKAGSVAFGR